MGLLSPHGPNPHVAFKSTRAKSCIHAKNPREPFPNPHEPSFSHGPSKGLVSNTHILACLLNPHGPNPRMPFKSTRANSRIHAKISWAFFYIHTGFIISHGPSKSLVDKTHTLVGLLHPHGSNRAQTQTPAWAYVHTGFNIASWVF